MPRFAAKAALILLLAGLVSGGLSGSSGAAGEAPARLYRVVIEDFVFRPQRLELRPGDSVEWVNLDLAPHSVRAEAGSWDSGELAKGETYRRTFGTGGRIAYLCAFHPMMRGEIVVAPGPGL